jgi:hypothetical protein
LILSDFWPIKQGGTKPDTFSNLSILATLRRLWMLRNSCSKLTTLIFDNPDLRDLCLGKLRISITLPVYLKKTTIDMNRHWLILFGDECSIR